MLSKSKIKYIRSLERKKNRKDEQAFVAEGPKLVGDLLGHFPCKLLVATAPWMEAHPFAEAGERIPVTADELARASLQPAPQEVLAVFRQPAGAYRPEAAARSLCLALDDVQDPGNLGTIIRLADWFGIEQVFCSPGTADAFQPKAVQATMGALARVNVHYLPLLRLIRDMGEGTPVYGTFLDGKAIYEEELSAAGLVVLGNEGKGISPEVARLVSRRLHIPSYPPERATSESLNVAMAAAVVCAEFRRRKGKA